MPVRLKPKPKERTIFLRKARRARAEKAEPVVNACIFDSIAFSFSKQCSIRKEFSTARSGSFRGSDNSVYQTPPAPKNFMDCSIHSEDLSFSLFAPESDQISLSSTASSHSRDRRTDGSSTPLYLPMTRSSHSPSSNNKVSVSPPGSPPPSTSIDVLFTFQPTPPKKPPRRNLSVSPTHLQPMMSASVEGVSNNAYEYLFLARSGAKSQSDLDDIDSKPGRQLRHGRSVDTYVEMNAVFSLAPDEIDEVPHRELHRGKSEDLDAQRPKQEPVAITAMYENMVVKAQNPRRKLRRNVDRDNIYEQYDFHHPEKALTVSAPDTYVTSAYLSIKSSQEDLENSPNETNDKKNVVQLVHIPLSPTHYNQPPTPDHPPPTAFQAEKSIHERIRPLSQVS